jgi:hypothetical protein
MGSFINRPDFVTTASSVSAGDTGLSHCIYVGVTGNLAVVPYGQTASVTFVGIPAGTFLPIVVSEIKVTGTTATSLLKLQ